MRRRILQVAAVAAWIASAAAFSVCAEPAPSPAPAPSAAPAPQGSDAGPIRVQMKEVEIRGEVERPEVFYIIPRKEARMDLGPLSKDFRDEIMEPLLPGPFGDRVKGRLK